jgi:hypothetical protein
MLICAPGRSRLGASQFKPNSAQPAMVEKTLRQGLRTPKTGAYSNMILHIANAMSRNAISVTVMAVV